MAQLDLHIGNPAPAVSSAMWRDRAREWERGANPRLLVNAEVIRRPRPSF